MSLLLDLFEQQTDRARQLEAEDALVDEAGGAGVAIDRSGVERRPSSCIHVARGA